MLRLHATITDDRGREVDLVTPKSVSWVSKDPAAAPAIRGLLEMVTRIESERLDWRKLGLALVAIAGLLVARAWLRSPGVGVPRIAGTVVFWGGIAAVGVGMRAITRRSSGGPIAATAVSWGVCGSCGYTLEGLNPEADGCVVCPECGAAWSGFRVTRPHWSAAERPPRVRAGRMDRWLSRVPRDKQLMGPDARRGYFRMLDKRLRLVPGWRLAEIGPERAAAVRKRLGRIGLGWRFVAALLPLGIAAGLAVGMVNISLGSGWIDWAVIVGLAGLAVIFAMLAVAVVRGHSCTRPGRIGTALAEMGLCGTCGNELEKGWLDPDGCSVCVGCGAAWRVRQADEAAQTR